VEVQVYGGAPILGARVEGRVQILDQTEQLNRYERVVFHDDGKEGDRTAEDGVYTAAIATQGWKLPESGADFRVLIQADAISQPGGRGERAVLSNVRVERFGPGVDPRKESVTGDPQDPRNAPALQFQRATTFRFHVK
jgi:hypothetical protein